MNTHAMMPRAAHCACGRARGAMLTLLGLVGAKRTIPAWLVETLQYVLSTFEFFVDLFLRSWLLRWTDLFAFFFVTVASHRLRSSPASALDFAKYLRCEGPAALSFPSSIAEKSPPNSVLQLYRRSRVLMYVPVTHS